MSRKLIVDQGKGGRQEFLPSRHALATVAGPASRRTINDYAKATPGVVAPRPTFEQMGSFDDPRGPAAS